MPPFEHLIAAYGYVVVLAGTFLEGETVLLAAGFLAHRGYLSLGLVFVCALCGSLAGDQFFFLLGRRGGQPFLARHPLWAGRAARVDGLLQRHRTPVLLGFRFVYGLRTAIPLAVGLGSTPAWLFAVFNAAGALLWTVVVGGAGYLFGSTLEALLGSLVRYERWVAGGIVLAGLGGWVFRRLRRTPR